MHNGRFLGMVILSSFLCINCYGQLGKQQLIANYLKTNEFSGTYLVHKRGEEIAKGALGKKNKNDNNSVNTLYNIGSISKSMIAHLITLQARDKTINLDRPVNLSFPVLRHPNITWHHILTHTSGLPDFQNLNHAIPKGPSIFPVINQMQLSDEPGKAFRYNSLGYYVLETYLEFYYRKPIGELLSSKLFAPIGLTNTYEMGDLSVNPDIALGSYVLDDETKYIPLKPDYKGNVQLYSTVENLKAYFFALLENTFNLNEGLMDRIMGPNKFNYGYGWVVSEKNEERIIMHGGQSPGFSAYIRYNQDEEVLSILLSNQEDTNLPEMSLNVENISLSRELGSIDVPKLPDPLTSHTNQDHPDYELWGEYRSQENEVIRISKQKDIFLFSGFDFIKKELIRRSEKQFVVRIEEGGFLSYYPVEFIIIQGNPTELIWDGGKKFKKIK